MADFDLSKITGREPPVETDEDMMNALADALGDADALRTERDAMRARVAEQSAALAAILEFEPECCPCRDPGCTATRDAWDKARAALGLSGNKEGTPK